MLRWPPGLGTLSERIGRRPVLLYSMAGMCLNFLGTAWTPSLAWLSAAMQALAVLRHCATCTGAGRMQPP